VTDDPEALRLRMIADLAERGELDERWRAAFLTVPRHAFIPDLVWRQDRTVAGDRDLVPMRRADDPDGWLELAYANDSVNTQVDDGAPADDECGFEVTSSASMPAVVAQMLGALDAQPGMRVLEIGTGTGYNTALLAYHLGAENVVSIEIDPETAEHARRALAAAGFGAVTVITGDGAHGHPPCAPYDRVLATAAAQQVPHAWVAQTRPGGRVLTPWGTSYWPGGLLALTVHGDGDATGRIIGPAAFMWLREQRIPRYTVAGVRRSREPDTVSSTDLHPYYAAGDMHAATAIGLRVPRCESLFDTSSSTLYLVDQWGRSWATLDTTTGPPYEVLQAGERKLWDEVHTAYRWWVEAGEPAVNAWRFTITPTAQHIELASVTR